MGNNPGEKNIGNILFILVNARLERNGFVVFQVRNNRRPEIFNDYHHKLSSFRALFLGAWMCRVCKDFSNFCFLRFFMTIKDVFSNTYAQ